MKKLARKQQQKDSQNGNKKSSPKDSKDDSFSGKNNSFSQTLNISKF